jgi:uncharacterized membrane protein
VKIGLVRRGCRDRVAAARLESAPGIVARVTRLVGTLGLVMALAGVGAARADTPVVRAVLFFLPSCGHCERVMTVDLPPLLATHGDALQIVFIDVSLEQGAAFYESAVVKYGLHDRRGVPTLIVGDTALVGSAEIPGRLPVLVDELLAAGGTDWPDLPGLVDAISAAASTAPGPSTSSAPNPSPTAPPAPSPSASRAAPTASPDPASPAPAATAAPAGPAQGSGPLDRLARDPAGNGLALVVLVLIAGVLAAAAVVAWHSGAALVARPPAAIVAVMAIAGLGVAAYLAFVETASVEAVCGPVGDCNTVQQSTYARLFGIVPIGVAGVAGYAAILGAWVVGTRGAPDVARAARAALIAMAFAGTAFSLYLTILEPFVIGATCAWCLASAVLMTGILATSVRPAPGARLASRDTTDT